MKRPQRNTGCRRVSPLLLAAIVDFTVVVAALFVVLWAVSLALGQSTCYVDPTTGRQVCTGGNVVWQSCPQPQITVQQLQPSTYAQQQQSNSQAWLQWRRGVEGKLQAIANEQQRQSLHVAAVESKQQSAAAASSNVPDDLLQRFDEGAQVLQQLQQDVADLKAGKQEKGDYITEGDAFTRDELNAVIANELSQHNYVTMQQVSAASQQVDSANSSRLDHFKNDAIAAAVDAGKTAAAQYIASAATTVAANGLPAWLPLVGGVTGPLGAVGSIAAVWMLRRLNKRLSGQLNGGTGGPSNGGFHR